MKTIVLLLGSLLLAVTVRGTIVYDNLGPGGTYNPNWAYRVGASGYTAQFTATASGFLTTIDLGLTIGNHAGPVNVFLDRNGGSVPSNNPTFLGSGAPTAFFDGTSNDSLVSITVVGAVPVTMGSNYWIVVKDAPGTDAFWNLSSPPTMGLVSLGFPLPTGFTEGINQTLPAFRVTAQPVPELNVTVLLLVGLVVAVFPLKRTVLRDRVR